MVSATAPHDSLVSVVIVAHDNWPDLELALESALNQSYPAVEVILVDNGSTDATQTEIAARYQSRLRYMRQSNLHDAAGYNRGVAKALGEFIQLLDGDDFIAPNKIEKQVEALLQNPEADIAYGDVRQFQSLAGRPD